MGATKKDQYSSKQLSFALTAKALGHPARIAIIQHLAKQGLSNNYTFMLVTQLAHATVCQHLAVLQQAGIIDETFVYDQHYYFLTDSSTASVIKLKRVILPSRSKRNAAKKRIP